MLIECGYCGAPLDVPDGTQTSKCRYCGKSSRVGARTIAQQTPPNWAPPQRWRPPEHVPANSDEELSYRGSGGGGGVIVAIVVVLLAGGGITAAVLASHGAIGGLDPAKLDDVTLLEAPTALQSRIGGTWSESAHWVIVNMKSPFQTGVFSYSGDARTRPSSVMLNTGATSCSSELEAMRRRLRARLGQRFDGKNWRWGPAHLNFGENCSNISFGSTVEKGNEELASAQSAALWKLVRKEVFGRPGDVDAETIAGVLGGGYSGKTVADALTGSTVDDAMKTVPQKLPGVVLDKSAGVRAQIALSNPLLGQVDVAWENKKAGPLKSLHFRARDNKLGDPSSLAHCIAKKTGGSVEIKETDYAAKKTDAYLTFNGARGNVSDYGLSVYADYEKVFPKETLAAVFLAIDACAAE